MSATPSNRTRIIAALAVALLAAGVFIVGWRDLIGSLPFMSEARVTLVGNAFRPMLIAAILYSIPLAVVSFLIGLVIALLVALVRVVPATGIAHRLLLALVHAYVSAIRGTPMLVQLMIVFYGLPQSASPSTRCRPPSSASRSTSAPTPPKPCAPPSSPCRAAD